MSDKIFLDSNICVYLFDKDQKKAETAKSLFTTTALVSTQVLAVFIRYHYSFYDSMIIASAYSISLSLM